jgi:hypothetical protein
MMIDGVPREAGVQPLGLSGPSSLGWRQRLFGSGLHGIRDRRAERIDRPRRRGFRRLVPTRPRPERATGGGRGGRAYGRPRVWPAVADSPCDVLVVGVVGRCLPGRAAAGFVERPPQQRRPLPSPVATGASRPRSKPRCPARCGGPRCASWRTGEHRPARTRSPPTSTLQCRTRVAVPDNPVGVERTRPAQPAAG